MYWCIFYKVYAKVRGNIVIVTIILYVCINYINIYLRLYVNNINYLDEGTLHHV